VASVRSRTSATGESSWQVLYRHGKRQTSKTFESEKKATDFKVLIDQFGVEQALTYLADSAPVVAGMTVDDLAEKWLATKAGEVTPSIHVGYRRDYDNWVSPYLGHREAARLTEVDVQDWIDRLKVTNSPVTHKPLSAKSIADRHAILHQVFKWGSAKTRNLVPYNPCKETDLPKRTRTPIKGLRIPELLALLSAGKSVDQDAADLIAFMAGTGWRISEAIALPAWVVEEVVTQDGTAAVYVTMEQVRRRSVGVVKGGKSDASVGRRLRVLGPGADVLRRRIVGLAPHDLVFTFKDGRPGVNRSGPWNENSFRDLRWPRIVQAAGLADRKPTPHWLRHTHVALCHAAGMSLAEIQRRLGHEDIQTTINIYGRMIEDMNDQSAARAEALFLPPTVALGSVVTGELD